MEAGAYVWIRDAESDEAWLLCEVVTKTNEQLTAKQKDKPSNVITRGLESLNEETGERKFDGVELANTPLSEEEKEEGRDNDLISLPHLHEPALLHALSDRFFRGKIYTWTGPVLIAVNPFQRLALYTNDILEAYRRDGLLKAQGMQQSGNELEPHIFAIADRSYRQMMGEKRRSQAILISGESGAGKTESTKIVMLYLTTLGAGNNEDATTNGGDKDGEDLSVMQRVLQSNPVLEAFGNARTLRNDNSSRFGKFIELGFSRAGHLMGAKVQTYLLEKVRLAFHAAGERNYHIFYQLLRGCKDEDHPKYDFHDGLTGGLELPAYFHYTGQGGAPHLREFTDESGLEYTLKAMRRLGWSQETIDGVLSLIAGLLHLGQISFNALEKDGVETAQVADDTTLKYSSRLLGVDIDLMRTALTERIIITRGEEIRTALTPDKASDARDALAKTIYGALFLWVVDQVNQSIGWKNDNDVRSSCGVLDIFGFECFAVNSFEQLCINYTNEALQQQFNQFIFKLEQAEYESEAISWAFIEFPDNQDCLDTIQAPKVGILSMLDDECRLPKGSDKNWCKRMYDQYLPEKKQTVSTNTRFSASNVQKAKSIFCVRHFAGIVQYSAETSFLEKNKDEIPITARKLFETAPSQLMQDTFAIQKRENEDREAAASSAKAKGGRAPKQKTVGQQFKEQLSSLIENVQKTDPHYIRCIKPNDAAKPLLMTRKRTTEQLRYGGVLEAVRVARAGYPVRMIHAGFYQRYRMLLPTTPDRVLPWNMEGKNAQQLCVKLVDEVLAEGVKHAERTAKGPLDPAEPGITKGEKIRRMQNEPIPMHFPKGDVQLGKTKVFMRKHPHDCMEAHRVFHQHSSATIVQCWARGLAEQRKYFIVQDAVAMIQRCYRGSKGRERWTRLRKAEAGMLLTKVFRMLISWRKFNRSKKGTIRFQALVRGYNLRRDFAAVKVQKYQRMYVAKKKFRMLVSAVLSLQCTTRKRRAKKVLDDLKKEQKDVGKLKQNNEKLKQEMASLRAMLAAQAKESAADIAHTEALKEKEAEIMELEKRIAEIEKELAKAKAMVEKLENDLKVERETSAKEREQFRQRRVEVPEIHRRRPSSDGHAAPQAPPPPPPQPQTQPAPAAPQKQQQPQPGKSPVIQERKQETHPAPPMPSQQVQPAQATPTPTTIVVPAPIPADYVSPTVLAEHRARVATLATELEAERRLRREADGEIIKLRAAINGVKLDDSEVNALLATQLDETPKSEQSSISGDDVSRKPSRTQDAPEITGREPHKEESKDAQSPEVREALSRLGLGNDKKEEKPGLLDTFRAGADLIPMIRRGFTGTTEEKEEEDVVAVGWKVEVTNRREREELLRDDVHRFENRLKKSKHLLEEGVDVVMWQLNKGGGTAAAAAAAGADIGGNGSAAEATDEFAMKSSNITIKLQRRGDMLVQAALTFMIRGGYLSKAIGRTRPGDKTALEPLSLHDILDVKAGCSGYDHTELPSASGKSKSKKSSKSENTQASLFLTVKATPTPVATQRSYIFRFKSRSARNDVLNGLRAVLADMQVHEGVSVSGLQTNKEANESEEILVPLSAVYEVINREREHYDRILLMLLQGTEDLKEKEDELLSLRSKLQNVVNESREKDRIQANDSKLIMQLSKKLETLLMDNEDLRDQNDRLNTRLVTVESDHLNMSGRS